MNNQFAELLLVPAGDDDPLMRIAAIAASEEIVVREIIDNGAERLPRLAAPLTDLAMRILTPTTQRKR